MDPNNPVVKLCLAGMRADSEDQPDQARALFEQAWQARQDDYDACLAAHFVARHQPAPEEKLRWNQTALGYAEALGDERVLAFYPSLHLNVGWSHERLGNLDEARRHYELAAAKLGDLPAGRYGAIVRGGVVAGRRRTR